MAATMPPTLPPPPPTSFFMHVFRPAPGVTVTWTEVLPLLIRNSRELHACALLCANSNVPGCFNRCQVRITPDRMYLEIETMAASKSKQYIGLLDINDVNHTLPHAFGIEAVGNPMCAFRVTLHTRDKVCVLYAMTIGEQIQWYEWLARQVDLRRPRNARMRYVSSDAAASTTTLLERTAAVGQRGSGVDHGEQSLGLLGALFSGGQSAASRNGANRSDGRTPGDSGSRLSPGRMEEELAVAEAAREERRRLEEDTAPLRIPRLLMLSHGGSEFQVPVASEAFTATEFVQPPGSTATERVARSIVTTGPRGNRGDVGWSAEISGEEPPSSLSLFDPHGSPTRSILTRNGLAMADLQTLSADTTTFGSAFPLSFATQLPLSPRKTPGSVARVEPAAVEPVAKTPATSADSSDSPRTRMRNIINGTAPTPGNPFASALASQVDVDAAARAATSSAVLPPLRFTEEEPDARHIEWRFGSDMISMLEGCSVSELEAVRRLHQLECPGRWSELGQADVSESHLGTSVSFASSNKSDAPDVLRKPRTRAEAMHFSLEGVDANVSRVFRMRSAREVLGMGRPPIAAVSHEKRRATQLAEAPFPWISMDCAFPHETKMLLLWKLAHLHVAMDPSPPLPGADPPSQYRHKPLPVDLHAHEVRDYWLEEYRAAREEMTEMRSTLQRRLGIRRTAAPGKNLLDDKIIDVTALTAGDDEPHLGSVLDIPAVRDAGKETTSNRNVASPSVVKTSLTRQGVDKAKASVKKNQPPMNLAEMKSFFDFLL